LGLREDAVVYWSGQAIYKYHPAYDHVFADIAQGVPEAQFVFIEFAKSKAITQILKTRLEQAFAAAGLRMDDHCVFLPSMDQGRFLAAVGLADVMLDTIGWSGGRSTLDCLIQDPVIVTHDGPMMRGRHSAGILRRMGLPQTIAATVDEYVAIAIRLGRDPVERAAIKVAMAAKRKLVYRDRSYIQGLENLIEARVRAQLAAAPPEAGHAAQR
jgi:predicted O-linked N-acetylglucosamine transferase (SPINDLY family)